jgi:hypothetical protein
MRLRLLAAAVVLAGSLCAADPELLSLAPPDSLVMAGINIEQVSLSPFGQFLLTQSQQQADADLQKLADATGFDPRHDLKEILVAASGQPSSNSGIILARGTFDVPRIVEAAVASGATVETYKGVQIIQGKPKGQEPLAFPDSTIAIAGDAASVRAAIDRKSAPTAVSSALAVQVNLLSTTEDAWFVSMAPLSQLMPHAANANAQAAGPFAALDKVLQSSGGVKFGANVVLSLRAVCQTAQDASALANVLKSLVSIAGMNEGNEQSAAAMAALLQSLNVSADGTTVKISLSITEQQLEQMKLGLAGSTRRGRLQAGQPGPGK